MLKNENIICFSNNEWQQVPTSKEHIMKIFSKKNKVLYVENIGQRRPLFKLADFKRILTRLINWSTGLKKENPNLIIFSPLLLPFFSFKFVRNINRKILKNSIFKIMKKEKMAKPILWISIPTAVDLVGNLGEKLSIYHLIDDYSAFPTLSFKLISNLEKELLKKVDLVFVANKGLYEIKKKFHKKTYFMPHGANFAHFFKILNQKTNEAKELKKIKKPRIGFAGKIGYSTDLSLIEYLAKKNPKFSFVLLGPLTFDTKKNELEKLKNHQNVYFLGEIPYQKLPLYLKYIDVCLLPYRLTSQIKYAQPQIMSEYLSQGRPIVSVDIGASYDFQDLVYIAKNYEDFNQKLKIALEENYTLVKKRIKAAKANSWPKRIEEISNIIHEYTNKH